MALFSRKKDSKETATAKGISKKKTPEASTATVLDRDIASVIVKPRITEKAVTMNEKNVYTFVVRRDATKYDVRDAVKALFDVTPVKINIVNKMPRSYMARAKGRVVRDKGMKKAYVYLKEGDSITLV